MSVQTHWGGIFDYAGNKERLEEVDLILENPAVWEQPEQATILGQERARLERLVHGLEQLQTDISDSLELLELVALEEDAQALDEVEKDANNIDSRLEKMEFRRMFSGEADSNNAFIDIQAGSGGTEAQDWAAMLLRMYLRWGEAQGYNLEVVERSPGDVAGIKSATVKFIGRAACQQNRLRGSSDSLAERNRGTVPE